MIRDWLLTDCGSCYDYDYAGCAFGHRNGDRGCRVYDHRVGERRCFVERCVWDRGIRGIGLGYASLNVAFF